MARLEYDPLTQIDYAAGVDPEEKGAECGSCFRLYTYDSGMFTRDTSYKNGYKPQCNHCRKQPRLSLSEHVARLQELNYNNEGTKRQRHEDQADFRQDRQGRPMDCSLFLQKLLHIYPGLYVKAGGVVGDLALYATGLARPEWNGATYKYLGYVTLGTMPEFSEYEFDNHRDVLIRVKKIGWRSVLLRFVENNILTEKQCDAEFGPASGGVNSTWYKNLNKHRNRKAA